MNSSLNPKVINVITIKGLRENNKVLHWAAVGGRVTPLSTGFIRQTNKQRTSAVRPSWELGYPGHLCQGWHQSGPLTSTVDNYSLLLTKMSSSTDKSLSGWMWGTGYWGMMGGGGVQVDNYFLFSKV